METTNTKNQKTLTLTIVGAVLIAAGIFLFGFWVGNQVGKQKGITEGSQKAESQYKPLLNVAFPEPPAVMNKVSGVVEKVEGNIITIKINDPKDYLPHLDGSPRATVEKQAIVSPSTSYTLIDYTKLDKNGAATVSKITLNDVKPGNAITVASNENIRTNQKFQVNSVQISKY